VHGMDWAGTLEIGPGFQLPHTHGTLLIQGAKIGRDVIILHNVTIGGVDDGRPVLGDRVRIFPGVVIYGSPTIGDDVVISANCVVHRDVPANSLVTQRGILPVKAAPILQAAEAAENTG
jgi:serine O-acetyltransferase